jgi:hypothetical protein
LVAETPPAPASPLAVIDAELARNEQQPDLWVKRAMILKTAPTSTSPAALSSDIFASLDKALSYAPDHVNALVDISQHSDCVGFPFNPSLSMLLPAT